MLSKLTTLSALILAAAAQVPSQNPAVLTPFANDGLCLTATGQNNGASVDIETCAGRPEQKWNFANGAVSTFNGKKCLDVSRGADKDGTLVQVWDCVKGHANQQWYYGRDDRLAWTGHGKCLDLTNGKARSGTKVQIWSCTCNSNNQVWNAAKTASAQDSPHSSCKVSTELHVHSYHES